MRRTAGRPEADRDRRHSESARVRARAPGFSGAPHRDQARVRGRPLRAAGRGRGPPAPTAVEALAKGGGGLSPAAPSPDPRSPGKEAPGAPRSIRDREDPRRAKNRPLDARPRERRELCAGEPHLADVLDDPVPGGGGERRAGPRRSDRAFQEERRDRLVRMRVRPFLAAALRKIREHSRDGRVQILGCGLPEDARARRFEETAVGRAVCPGRRQDRGKRHSPPGSVLRQRERQEPGGRKFGGQRGGRRARGGGRCRHHRDVSPHLLPSHGTVLPRFAAGGEIGLSPGVHCG